MNWIQVLFFIFYCPFGLSVLQEMIPWTKVRFSEDSLSVTAITNGLFRKKFQCALYCISRNDCNFWCIKTTGFCYLYNLVVSPAYVETNGGNIIDCYTKKRNDIAVSSKIISMNSRPQFTSDGPLIIPPNIEDGIKKTVYCTDYNSESHFIISLQKEAVIRDIIIYAPSSSFDLDHRCGFLEVRISSTLSGNMFDSFSWDLIYYLNRECETGGIEHLKPSTPQTGQFLLLRMKKPGYLCLEHLEIDGVFIDQLNGSS